MGAGTRPRRNRVTPLGDIVAIELRGAWTGNRGILHRVDRGGTEIVRHHTGIAWIACVLEFRGRRIPQWAPGHYTPLFFHDEAVAFAAGHRPCAQCRRQAFRAFADAVGGLRAPDLDRRLHHQRWRPGHGRILHELPWAALPDGTFVVQDDAPWLVLGDTLVGWSTQGYAGERRRPTTGTTGALTPPATMTVLEAGYPVQIDAGARRLAGQTRSGSGRRPTESAGPDAADSPRS